MAIKLYCRHFNVGCIFMHPHTPLLPPHLTLDLPGKTLQVSTLRIWDEATNVSDLSRLLNQQKLWYFVEQRNLVASCKGWNMVSERQTPSPIPMHLTPNPSPLIQSHK